ncbi:BTAD domain-containing putative transcriptional regulator [Streptomyces sp. NPDC098781]|uniref:BTAD domain-containing putative transcriptional regulator n=1 Tax=Streptomyces sp. NPDC098781 TaxID=3366097 RepID=UPI003829B0F2
MSNGQQEPVRDFAIRDQGGLSMNGQETPGRQLQSSVGEENASRAGGSGLPGIGRAGAPARPAFALLGPLEVRGASGPVEVGPPQRRVMLLRLLAEDGQPVCAERLCEDVWDGSPPSSAMSSLHAHISRLRSALEPPRGNGAPRLLVYTAAGYALRVPPEQRDISTFERAVEEAHCLADLGRGAPARREAERALSLWRGQPYADAHGRLFARRESDRLWELRRSAQELRARLLLEDGYVAQAVATAEELIGHDPLREASWVTLLRALYSAGRAAEALRRYDVVRRILAHDLGADPGPELAHTYLAILRHDTDALRVPRSRPASLTAELSKRPTEAAPLPGRDSEQKRLLRLLPLARSGRTAWAALSGSSGIGKTRLAEELAARAQDAGFTVLRRWYPKQDRQGAGTPLAGKALAELDRLRSTAEEERHDAAPVLCLFEDVQGAPSVDLNALIDYAETLHEAGVVVVCTLQATNARTDGLLAALAARGAEHLELGPLNVRDVEEVVAAADGGTDAAELHALTGGNPLYLTELLRLPQRRRSGPGLRVPTSLASVVRVRLGTLDDDARRVLETAAVLGDRIDIARLSRICAVPAHDVLRALDAGSDADLILETTQATEQEPVVYAFSCGLVRRVLLNAIPHSQKHAIRTALALRDPLHPSAGAMDTTRHSGASPQVDFAALAGRSLRAGQACLEEGRLEDAHRWLSQAVSAVEACKKAATSRTAAAPLMAPPRGAGDRNVSGQARVPDGATVPSTESPPLRPPSAAGLRLRRECALTAAACGWRGLSSLAAPPTSRAGDLAPC